MCGTWYWYNPLNNRAPCSGSVLLARNLKGTVNTLCNDMGHLCPLFSYLSLGKYAPPNSISSVTPGPSLLFTLGFLASSTVSAMHSLSLYCGQYYRMEAERLGTQFFWKLGASCAMLGSMLGFLSFDAGVKMPLCIDHFTCVCLVLSNSVSPWTVAHEAPGIFHVHGIFQARKWVAISYSRGSSQARDRTRISCNKSPALAGRFFTTASLATLEMLISKLHCGPSGFHCGQLEWFPLWELRLPALNTCPSLWGPVFLSASFLQQTCVELVSACGRPSWGTSQMLLNLEVLGSPGRSDSLLWGCSRKTEQRTNSWRDPPAQDAVGLWVIVYSTGFWPSLVLGGSPY